jgi:hypothetical protein
MAVLPNRLLAELYQYTFSCKEENELMGDWSKLSELHAKSQQNRLDFLQTDLALCFTFADFVKTELELGDLEAAQRVFARAEEGYAAIARFLPDVENAEHQHEIERKLSDLRTTLDGLQHQLRSCFPSTHL